MFLVTFRLFPPLPPAPSDAPYLCSPLPGADLFLEPLRILLLYSFIWVFFSPSFLTRSGSGFSPRFLPSPRPGRAAPAAGGPAPRTPALSPLSPSRTPRPAQPPRLRSGPIPPHVPFSPLRLFPGCCALLAPGRVLHSLLTFAVVVCLFFFLSPPPPPLPSPLSPSLFLPARADSTMSYPTTAGWTA